MTQATHATEDAHASVIPQNAKGHSFAKIELFYILMKSFTLQLSAIEDL